MGIVYYIKLYAITLPVFFAIDLLWLGVIAKKLYARYLGHLMKEQVNWTSAIVFYLLFIVGILIFAVVPALKEGSLSRALIYGALFGFFAYATYELTNLAVIRDWPIGIVWIDILWGIVLTGSVAGLSYLLGSWLLK